MEKLIIIIFEILADLFLIYVFGSYLWCVFFG